jgi:hypothetical protein
MTRLLKIILIFSLLTNFNANAQKLSKEEKKQKKIEKKQRKKDLNVLLENIKDTVPLNSQGTPVSLGLLACQSNLVKITFISKSLEYVDDISLINQLDLYKSIKFFDIYKDGNNVYMYMDGFGKSYPNSANMNDFIKCEELLNIYNFQKQAIKYGSCMTRSDFIPTDYLVIEYKKSLNNSQLSYVVIKKSEFERKIKILRKSLELKEQIANQEFIISYNNVSAYSGRCFKKLLKRKDFFIVNTDSADNNLKDEAKKMSVEWMKKESFFDTPTFYEKDFKSKSSNISSGTKARNLIGQEGRYYGKIIAVIDYDYIDFDFDSIKFYQLDIVSLLNSGILRDSIKSYWGKSFATSNYNDLNIRLTGKDYQNKTILDSYSAEEVEKMSEIDYWEKTLPKDKELKQFVNESYIKLSTRVNIEDYMNNTETNNSKFNFSQIAFDRNSGTVCANNYCKHQCRTSINYGSTRGKYSESVKMDVKCSLNWEGKQYNSNKYFYSSLDLKILRDDVVTLLADIFCAKSGVMNSEKKKKEKDQQYLNTLAKEYGLKYAKAAVKGDIIIGMPEDLLTIPLRAWNIDSSSEWERGYSIYCKFKFNTAKRIVVDVRDGKVTRIAKW